MQTVVRGLASVYDIEHLVRLFYPGAEIRPRRTRGQDAVIAHLGKRRMLAGLCCAGQCSWEYAPLPGPDDNQTPEYALAALVYRLLCRRTGKRPPWGMLTGVRPVRIIHDSRAKGMSESEIRRLFCHKYDVTDEKFELALDIANRQSPWMQADERDYSLYIGIPFCPSRCSYCSFVSRTIEKEKKLVQPYVDLLCRELEDIRSLADHNRLHLKTIYIGGGTPTSLSAGQLRQLMGTVRRLYDLGDIQEYTVEAGRPDCTDLEKLEVLKEYGATRISINPQTLSDEVLARIGRRHTAEDVIRCFEQARSVGHTNINMDLIAGLPGDTPDGFSATLDGVLTLSPENITVHTLTLKRASNLVIEQRQEEYGDVAQMISRCNVLGKAGYAPYYLYRQKGTLQNLENTGWCKPGYEGLYNIYIMEEVHTILSAGAGGSTKLRQQKGNLIKRVFNYKYPLDYINGFDAVLQRKEGVNDFYARYVDSQTSG